MLHVTVRSQGPHGTTALLRAGLTAQAQQQGVMVFDVVLVFTNNIKLQSLFIIF